MNRERILAVAIAVVAVAGLLTLAVLPGAIATASTDDPPSRLRIEDVAIAPGHVSGGTATLRIETRLDHRGGSAENISVLVRAIHLDSGLVEATTRTRVPTIDGERETSIIENLSVERRGGYRIETVVFENGERIAEGGKEVRGVDALEPAYERTAVDFHWNGDTSGLPPIDYSIADVHDDTASLNVSTYLTNRGDDASENVRIVFVARQADSNIVADRVSVPVGTIETGRTADPSATVTVPDGYNYYLDAILWKDGVVVGSARSAANLDPSKRLSVNETQTDVELSVSDFQEGDRGKSERTTRTANDGGQPGFTVLAGIVALLGAGLLVRRNGQP
ncbi:PGF-CTERM sorting domain-containing protein [Haladaptatus sp. AB643]|uniref:DUF7490 domain-containing protein n=1 Tax=Haladaptatus sp. AB643 TaxID=2934174 RepID=UPI00209BFBE5|nr:PGF-CTERM sorting domain-containing protein [Haladaptatus sp. AB643]MCO8243110.1 PGF-CTERM sorting domain-containing protein [Haladaptatus sp. AB643]